MNQPQLGSFESIALASIRPSTTNPRKHFDDAALEEMAESIKSEGILQPLLLRPFNAWHVEEKPNFDLIITDGARRIVHIDGDRDLADEKCREYNEREGIYEVVAGERRWRAAKIAFLDEVPAVVREISDAEMIEIQITENLQRADLHPMEEAEAYKLLLDQGFFREGIAKKVGKDLAYVTKRVELLQLTPEARDVFGAQHIALGHALKLAALTPANQAAALCFLMDIRDWQISKVEPAEMVIARKLKQYTGMNHMKQAADRLVSPTEAQLADWIKSHVLLDLKTAPWDLGDATLLPEAGPCTSCPKRTGANQALFSELTTAQDKCTDSICYETKQKAFVLLTQVKATEKGSPLLKLSAKRSTDKLTVAPVELKPAGTKAKGKAGDGATQVMKRVTVVKKVIKEGQWVEAKKGSCPMVVEGVLTDGPNMGQTRYVCTDQACKVHKHVVTQTVPKVSASGSTPKASPETQAKAEAERELLSKVAEVSDAAILSAVRGKIAPSMRFLERALASAIRGSYGDTDKNICEAFDLKVKGWKPGTRMNHMQSDEAHKAIEKYLVTDASLTDLHVAAFEMLAAELIDDSDEDKFDELVKLAGVDAGAIRKRVEQELRATPTLKPEVKKDAAKKGQKSPNRALSPESRQRIADAIKRRFSGTDADESTEEALDDERDEQEGADLVDALDENLDENDEDAEDE